ncbi:MAG: 16S rRNA (guanine(966)-N(2))-methyltransferase RsmD [Kiritimatiellia bacterium]|nr:16S rRNA (guanine(966)-N(2))-methyltransferase RsmD [Kiritimatiellia bacterium]
MSIRITGGLWRGRLLDVPKKGVRPTQDRVRAAIFSSLQDIIPGARVLDLFAGTGAFGLEALSRGAAFACFVEKDRAVLAYLRNNVARLICGGDTKHGKDTEVDKFLIIRSDAMSFMIHSPDDGETDIIFADPPYDSGGEWSKKILFYLSRRSILAEKGYLIIESGVKSPLIKADGWDIYREKLYGETRICIYKVHRSRFGV